MIHQRHLIIILAGMALFPAVTHACDVPVFSYAMQHWAADPYRISVFHDSDLTPAEEALLEQFAAVAAHEALETNLELHRIDVRTATDEHLLAFQREYVPETLPAVVVQYPVSSGIQRPLYVGPLTETLLGELADSPVRKEIIDKLVGGSVAVWVLLESGNRRDDNAAAKVLETELQRMEQVLQLPEVSVWAWSDTLYQAVEEGMGIRFPLIRLSRDAPEERLLVKMLLNSEPDLPEIEDAPMVFPIYGRGLALYALVGKGINEWTIADACEFVVGPCSCQIKASNPGTDLLLSANWSQHIGESRHDQVAPLAGFADFFERGEAAAAQLADDPDEDALVAEILAAGQTETETASEAGEMSYASWIISGGAIVLIVLGLFFYVSYKQALGKE